jgi:predicted PurR-regulated permease PerM
MKVDIPIVTKDTPQKRMTRRILLGVVALVAAYMVYLVLPQISDIVTMVIISLVFAYLLRPVVGWAERQGLQRIWSITIIFVVVTALLVVALNFLVPMLIDQLGSLVDNLKQFNLQEKQKEFVLWVEEASPGLADTLGLEQLEDGGGIAEKVNEFAQTLLSRAIGLLAGLANVLSLMSVMPFIIFFILKDGDKFMHQMISRVPNRFFEMTLSLIHRLDQRLSAYIISVMISSSFVGLLTWLLFELVGIKYALVLGIVGALLNVIPFFGPLLTIIPTTLVVVLTYEPIGLGLLWMTIVLLGVQQVESMVIKPAVMSKSLDIHAVTVILVVLIGGKLAGALGMFIAVPVYSILQLIVVDLYGHLRDYRII